MMMRYRLLFLISLFVSSIVDGVAIARRLGGSSLRPNSTMSPPTSPPSRRDRRAQAVSSWCLGSAAAPLSLLLGGADGKWVSVFSGVAPTYDADGDPTFTGYANFRDCGVKILSVSPTVGMWVDFDLFDTEKIYDWVRINANPSSGASGGTSLVGSSSFTGSISARSTLGISGFFPYDAPPPSGAFELGHSSVAAAPGTSLGLTFNSDASNPAAENGVVLSVYQNLYMCGAANSQTYSLGIGAALYLSTQYSNLFMGGAVYPPSQSCRTTFSAPAGYYLRTYTRNMQTELGYDFLTVQVNNNSGTAFVDRGKSLMYSGPNALLTPTEISMSVLSSTIPGASPGRYMSFSFKSDTDINGQGGHFYVDVLPVPAGAFRSLDGYISKCPPGTFSGSPASTSCAGVCSAGY